MLTTLVLGLLSAAAAPLGGAAATPEGAVPEPAAEGSPWYLDRAPVEGLPPESEGADPVLATALQLETLMRDIGVPGFYDGQFALTAGRFAELSALASDPDVHHVMRVMAVMALQEAEAAPEELAAVLEPLVIPAEAEWTIDYTDLSRNLSGMERRPQDMPEILSADLSRYARFALAKAGQPRLIREKLDIMEEFVTSNRELVVGGGAGGLFGRRLNQRARTDIVKDTWFSVGYYYQQFDDYENARRWFQGLCDALPGERDTRWAHYNLACIAALSGDPAEAVVQLGHAYEAGFVDVAWMQEDGDLVSLRERDDYRALLRRMTGADLRSGTPGPPTGESRDS